MITGSFSHRLRALFILCRGQRAIQETNFTRGRYKFTLCLFCDWTGPVCYDVRNGGMTKDAFSDVIFEELLEIVNPYPGPRSVLILDNCTAHHSAAVDLFAELTGCIVLYLPAYTPFLNLTEWIFQSIKAEERRKQIVGEYGALCSLMDSVEKQKGKPWHKVYKKLGFF